MGNSISFNIKLKPQNVSIPPAGEAYVTIIDKITQKIVFNTDVVPGNIDIRLKVPITTQGDIITMAFTTNLNQDICFVKNITIADPYITVTIISTQEFTPDPKPVGINFQVYDQFTNFPDITKIKYITFNSADTRITGVIGTPPLSWSTPTSLPVSKTVDISNFKYKFVSTNSNNNITGYFPKKGEKTNLSIPYFEENVKTITYQ